MQQITSIDNQKIKHIIKLSDKKYRSLMGEYVVEGLRWVFDTLKSEQYLKNKDLLVLIAVSQSRYRELEGDLSYVLDKLIVCDDKIFDKISALKANQGILAVLKNAEFKKLSSNFCLFLDRIRDPGNLGTIIRTACATGFNDIICNNCVDIYNPKVVQSTMTALLNINITECNDYSYLEQLKNDGFTIVSADMGGENVFNFKERFNKLCLIIGSEAEGVSDDALGLSDKIFSIPMQGIESLNASVSAGILMYLLKFQ